MCVHCISEVEVLDQDLVAYKIVSGTKRSRYLPELRELQEGFKDTGLCIQYKEGKVFTSSFDTTPGLYCYALKKEVLKDAFSCEYVFKVLIPKGTKIKRAEGDVAFCKQQGIKSNEVILTEKLLVMEVIE